MAPSRDQFQVDNRHFVEIADQKQVITNFFQDNVGTLLIAGAKIPKSGHRNGVRNAGQCGGELLNQQDDGAVISDCVKCPWWGIGIEAAS